MDFRPIELSDKELIERYTFGSGVCNCDLSFANIYLWRATYHSAWALIEGFLVIRFRIGGGEELGYMQPIAQGGAQDFSSIIPHLAQDAHSHGQRLRIIGITQSGMEALNRSHPHSFALYSDRNSEDYIYLREELELLSGRRFQPKRNHINQFQKLYQHSYHPLTQEYISGCRELCHQWQQQHTDSDATVSAEAMAIDAAFENFEALGLQGGVITIEDKVVAFTYGSAINDDTFCTHIEKCDTSYTGIYSAINKLFTQSLPPNFTHINREEDMGIEGLRHSKLSYHPVRLESKHTAIYLHDHEAGCKSLWQTVFGDDDEFVDHFLHRYFSGVGMLSVVDPQGEYLSMLHIIPMSSKVGRIAYIYGVATHPECRAKGYATKLMLSAMEVIKRRGYVAAMLIPSEEWLKEYYSRFGFSPSAHITFSTADGFDFGTGDSDRDISMVCSFDPAISVGSELMLRV